jgi:hypothetical protein
MRYTVTARAGRVKDSLPSLRSMNWIDIAVLAAYLIGITVFGGVYVRA